MPNVLPADGKIVVIRPLSEYAMEKTIVGMIGNVVVGVDKQEKLVIVKIMSIHINPRTIRIQLSIRTWLFAFPILTIFSLLVVSSAGPTQTPKTSPLSVIEQSIPKAISLVQKKHITQGSPWGLCGRQQDASQRSSGFTGDITGTYINTIQVKIQGNTYSTVTIKWANKNLSSETLPTRFKASPGAGNCNLDCRSIKQSQQNESHCTPLSPPTYVVQGYNCALTYYPEAKFVTWFHGGRGIAFHSYTVPSYPASHGCVRLQTKEHGAEWIYDNSLPGITKVKIDWDSVSEGTEQQENPPSPKCWLNNQLILRP
jgi:L,D-transpeptidase catalytic domain